MTDPAGVPPHDRSPDQPAAPERRPGPTGDGPTAATGGGSAPAVDGGETPVRAGDATDGPAVTLRPAVPVDETAPPPGAVVRHRRVPPLATVVAALPGRAGRATLGWSARVGRALLNWSGRPSGRLALPGMLLAALLAAGFTFGAVMLPAASPAPEAATPGVATGRPTPTTEPPAVPPVTLPEQLLTLIPTLPPVVGTPTGGTGGPGPGVGGAGGPPDLLAGWATEMSDRTGIPEIALRAYGYAELVLASTTPDCHLSWTTLAAIGRVESHHGSSGGARLRPDGRAVPPIIGLPLDGRGGRQHIPDTDDGDLDNDDTYDRAVGPMQFIPSTWEREAVDATGDGVADVHNVHDAALAAGNYLCADGRDLATAADWWSAVLSYNNVATYADAVFTAADDYGRRSRAD